MSRTAPIPVTLLTGFLGAGKTTLLNRILTERHGERIAVIENEFGEVGVDNELLLGSDETIVEMNNGCICCTVRGDLIRILSDLAIRREAGLIDFARVIIETTGLADPGPVAQTFFADEDVARCYKLDAVVTVVDAVHGAAQLDAHGEARAQAGFADRLLLSKTDLAEPAALAALTARLRAINPRARLMDAPFGNAPLDALLDVRGFDLDAILEVAPDFLTSHRHHHQDDISAFVFEAERDFDGARLEDFLGGLVMVYGNDLLRYKGVLAMDGRPERIVFQGVHMMMGGTPEGLWPAGQPRRSRFVFIGRNLPRELLERGLNGCLQKPTADVEAEQ